MSRPIFVLALLALAAAPTAARAESIVFPPFLHGSADTATVIVPKCEISGPQMKCEFLSATLYPMPHSEPGVCYLHIAGQSLSFTRADADSWTGEIVSSYCQAKSTFRLSQSAAAPRRITLRVTFEAGEKTEECQKSIDEIRRKLPDGAFVLEWTEGDPGKALPLAAPACKSFMTGPGRFPSEGFPR